MTTDINIDNRRLAEAVKYVKRTISQELIEMARFQPPRFHDFVQNLNFIRDTPVHTDDMLDEEYDTWCAAHLLLDVLDTIPQHRLVAKEKYND